MELAGSSAAWKVHGLLSKRAFQAALNAGITRLQAQLLHNRGVQTVAAMQAFLHADYAQTPDPLTLIDMPRAVARIRQALEQQEHITVYGDYDADGVTSSALLFRALRNLKHPDAILDFHIPDRLHDGCGLNLKALDLLKQRGTRLIITTDCASSDVEQVAYAHTLNIDVIITDHHHPPAVLPDAYAMVNPWRLDCTYGERYLCGAGTAFKVVQALYRSYHRPLEEEMDLLDLVAVGTIADIAPLLGENHTLVRLGLQKLNTTHKPGLQALIRSAKLQPGRIRERDIAFGLAPRINAAGRMKDAGIAFRLLTTDSEQEAAEYTAELEQLNITRQMETEELMRNVREQAHLQPGKPVVLVSGENWHEGIIGLVAGKLAEEIHKPVLVLSMDNSTQLSRGSARSQKGFNIIEALRGFSNRLERYGGHAQAAGFTIRSELIGELHDHLVNWKEPEGTLTVVLEEPATQPDDMGEQPQPDASPAVPESMIDLTFTQLERLTYQLYKEMRQLSPFGAGNPEPVFKMEHVRLLDKWASGINRQNLRLRLGTASGNAQITGILTRGAELVKQLDRVKYVTILFKLEANDDEQKPEIWLKLLSVEPEPQLA